MIGIVKDQADKSGTKVNYSSFNSSQAFLDEYENKTSSLSTNTGGNCQFYKSVMPPLDNTSCWVLPGKVSGKVR